MKTKQFLMIIMLLFIMVAAVNCSNQGFPDCCDASGIRDTPFKVTNIFGFKTGVRDVLLKDNDIEGYMFIISTADILTLKAAANSDIMTETGIVNGKVFFEGNPVSEVIVLPTDSTGRTLEKEIKLVDDNIGKLEFTVRNMFYNNLGRVPDINLQGTNEGGGFTVFNVEPGETFFWVSQGARGSGHFTVFDNEVSVGSFDVIPVMRKELALMGKLVEKSGVSLEDDLPAGTSSITTLGYNDNIKFFTSPDRVYETRRVYSKNDDSVKLGEGCIETPEEEFEDKSVTCIAKPVTLPVNGEFFIKVESTSVAPKKYWPTLQRVFTPISIINGLLPFQNLTLNFTGVSEQFTTSVANPASENPGTFKDITIEDGTGIILGSVKSGGGDFAAALMIDATVFITDATGESIGEIVYLDSEFNQIEGGGEKTSAVGRFVAFNIKSGPVFVRGIATPPSTQCFGTNEIATGGNMMLVENNTVSLDTLSVAIIPIGNCTDDQPSYTYRLSGTILNSDKLAVEGVNISFFGLQSSGVDAVTAVSDVSGKYVVNQSVDPTSLTPLIGSAKYVMRMEKPAGSDYLNTYGQVRVSKRSSIGNMKIMNTDSIKLDGVQLSLPLLKIDLIDLENSLSVEGVSIKVTGMDGQVSEDVKIYYYDENGLLSPTLTASSVVGGVVVAGIPSLSVEGSKDYTGLQNSYNIIVNSGDDAGTMIMQVYENNSVSTGTLDVNKSLPLDVNMKGFITSLDGSTPVGDAKVTIVGKPKKIENVALEVDPDDDSGFLSITNPELDTFQSGADGSFNKNMLTNANLILKIESNLCIDTYNYDVKVSLVDMQRDLYCATSVELERYRLSAGLSVPGAADESIIAGDLFAADLTDATLLNEIISTGATPVDVVVDYFNLDQNVDLIVANQADQSITFYFGSKDGSFNLSPADTLMPGISPDELIVVDLNQDSNKDIMVYDKTSGEIAVFIRSGLELAFEAPAVTCLKEVEGSPGTCISSLAGVGVADFNKDSFPDIVTINPSITTFTGINLYLNNQDATFNLPDATFGEFNPPLTANGLLDIAVADMNGNGLDDVLVISGAESSARLHLSGGDGSLTDGGEDLPPVKDLLYPVGGTPVKVLAFDMNSDSLPDIITINDDNNTLTLLKATQDRVQVVDYAGMSIYKVVGTPTDIATGDLDGDLRMDIVVAHANPSGISIYFGNGDVTLNPTPIVKAIGTNITRIVVTDLNDDASDDVLLVDSSLSELKILYRRNIPVEGVSLDAYSKSGDPTGRLFYFNDAGTEIDAGLTETSASGKFILFDSSEEFVMVQAKWNDSSNTGANGNKTILMANPASLTYTQIKVTTLPPGTVTVEGLTLDPVGASPGGTGVTPVQINILGSKNEFISENGLVTSGSPTPRNAAFVMSEINAASEYLMRIEYIGEGEDGGVSTQNTVPLGSQ